MIEYDNRGYRNRTHTNSQMYESNRIRVQLLILMLAVFIGCNGEDHSSVPVSVQMSPPYSYSGRIGRIWGGDNFEVVDNGKLHYAFIRGVDTPEPGQAYHDEGKAMLRQLARHRKTTVNVFDRDDWKREVTEVRISDPATDEQIDPALKLLQCGLAWFDQSDGPWAEKYREAETLARKEKIGIWSQPNPVPPWEFWEKQVQQIQTSE